MGGISDTLLQTIITVVLGGIFTLAVGLIAAVPGTLSLWLSRNKPKIEEADLIKKISLDLIGPLRDRISSLELEKVNWHLERALLIRQSADKDAVIADLRAITSKLVGGITALVSQLHENGFKPSFELNDEILETLKKHITPKKD